MARKPIPKYRRQRRSRGNDAAFVEIEGHRVYLGPYGSEESRERYARLLAEGGQVPVPTEEITVTELLARYWTYAEGYYSKPNGDTTSELEMLRLAMRPLQALYGHSKAADFGPKRLRAVRDRMIEIGWCRTYINRQVSRLKRIWKWASAEELVPPHAYHGLQSLAGLKRGRSEAHESKPVTPAPDSSVDATLPHLTPTLRAMVEVQRNTGMRTGEVVLMRTADLDMSGAVWVYEPEFHKTQYCGRRRQVFIGPKGQKILRPFLRRNLQEYIFCPARSEAERRTRTHEERTTPMSCGNRPGTNRKQHPRCRPGQRYTTDTYAAAIAYACRRAFPAPEGTEGETLRAWRRDHSWSPGRLRHTFASRIRREHGLESAQVLLGHSRADVTQVYAERDQARAVDVIATAG